MWDVFIRGSVSTVKLAIDWWDKNINQKKITYFLILSSSWGGRSWLQLIAVKYRELPAFVPLWLWHSPQIWDRAREILQFFPIQLRQKELHVVSELYTKFFLPEVFLKHSFSGIKSNFSKEPDQNSNSKLRSALNETLRFLNFISCKSRYLCRKSETSALKLLTQNGLFS